jgi:hypothetical protein
VPEELKRLLMGAGAPMSAADLPITAQPSYATGG